MTNQFEALLKKKMSPESFLKLTALNNPKLVDFVGKYTVLCEPDSVYMCDDSKADTEWIRRKSLENGEETPLAKENQTIHFDGYGDQGRDVANTRFIVPKEQYQQMKSLNAVEYEDGIAEIEGIAKGIMKGKQAIVKLFCEGPVHSVFSRPCVQFTDSFYVCHSETILYRPAYQHFMQMEDKNDFYQFVHSAGRLDDRGCTIDLPNRRIYMDCVNRTVYSMNAQYAGNSVGLKKHSMRLAIYEGSRQGWMCEHMFIMGIVNEEKKRTSYFCGAFPSACGKTATAMLPGEKIIGDDIAYFRNIDGEFRAANVEVGIFGIIQDVNPKDDPVIFKTLQMPKEMIFSNVLVGPDNEPYWLGMNLDTPKTGTNHSGPGWKEGNEDKKGKVIPLAHPNARYTIRMDYLENIDLAYNDKNGVLVDGIIYGGRDSDTSVPVEESVNWEDGIILKACTLESETTAATLGKEGVRKANLMANIEFISYPVGQYIQNNLDFTKGMKKVPRIFAVNYFLRNRVGEFCNGKLAKKVWIHWAEHRIHGEVDAYETPLGYIPKFEDLQPMFQKLLGENYTEENYQEQFQFRCDAWLAKLDRITKHFQEKFPDCPEIVYQRWASASETIAAAKEKYGAFIPPGEYQG